MKDCGNRIRGAAQRSRQQLAVSLASHIRSRVRHREELLRGRFRQRAVWRRRRDKRSNCARAVPSKENPGPIPTEVERVCVLEARLVLEQTLERKTALLRRRGACAATEI